MSSSRLLNVMLLLILTSIAAPGAFATYSIIACDPETGACGVAVATHNLAVGDGVPFAEAGIGAGVSQFETNACHGPAGLDALRIGATADVTVATALLRETACADGLGHAQRQLAIVSVDGASASHTGRAAGPYAGAIARSHVSVQGNGLASQTVLLAMLDTFEVANGSLGERLLLALEAGEAAGGQTIGVMSAALLVATPDGWPVDTDLRVDFAPGMAISELRTAHDARTARIRLFQAERLLAGERTAEAETAISEALTLAPDWDRVWLHAARLASDPKISRTRFCRFAELNPVWADRLEDAFDVSTCSQP